MSEQNLISKKQLRTERGWTHKQVRELGIPTDRLKTGVKGRPAFGYTLAVIAEAEKVRASA